MLCLAWLLPAGTVSAADATDHEARIRRLERLVDQLSTSLQAKDRQIVELQRRLGGPDRLAATAGAVTTADDRQQLLDSMLRDVSAPGAKVPELRQERLIDISAITNFAAGSSDSRDEEIADVLQSGNHDPQRRGFTLQQLELSIAGAVDPYFSGEAHIVFSEDEVEIEEAFATTTALPAGLQLKAGYFLTEFGRVNSAHPHSWDWLDQPLINGRLFGGEGTRAPGARLSWLTPLPWHSALSFGVQHSGGDFAPSFRGSPGGHAHGEEEQHHDEDEEELPEEVEEELHEAFGEEGIGGRPFYDSDTRTIDDMMYSLRWSNGFDIGDSLSAQLGLSGMWGRNGNGDSSHSTLAGADLVIKRAADDASLRRPRWVWQTELIRRDYEVDAFAFFDDLGNADPADDVDIDLPSDTLEDWGIYSQFVYALDSSWSAGVRYEWVTGSGDSAEEGELFDRNDDPNRGDRMRVSPMLMYQPTEFSRLRLQYNYDEADFITGGEAHSVWFGLEILLGSHPAHGY
jgi:hypothetical protein